MAVAPVNKKATDQNHVGNLNPFRYRGYYYDTESQRYYLMTRYYDPVVHRFLNADGYFQSGGALLDTHKNAYCGNSPVSNFDPDGTCWVPIYSTCGAQMGSKWKMMGSVPGVPYCCKKCGKNDPSYSTNSGKSNNKKPSNEYIGTTSSNQDVYIQNNSSTKNINDIYVLDLRNSKDPYFEVQQSYLVTQKEVQLEVIRMLQHYNACNPVTPAWERTNESMSMEWDIHNYAYNQLDGFLKERAADVSLNNADETLYYLMYKYDRFDM